MTVDKPYGDVSSINSTDKGSRDGQTLPSPGHSSADRREGRGAGGSGRAKGARLGASGAAERRDAAVRQFAAGSLLTRNSMGAWVI